MRKAPNLKVEQYRMAGPAHSDCGAFQIGQKRGPDLRVVVSAGGGLG